MFKKSAVWAAALFVALGAGAASAQDAAPSWSGFYGGLYVGVTHGVESKLETSADAQEKRTVGWCRKVNGNSEIFPNKDTEAQCEGVTTAEWKDASCPGGAAPISISGKDKCLVSEGSDEQVEDATCLSGPVNDNGKCEVKTTANLTYSCPSSGNTVWSGGGSSSTCTTTSLNSNQCTNANNGSFSGSTCTVNGTPVCTGTISDGKCVTSTFSDPTVCDTDGGFILDTSGGPTKGQCVKEAVEAKYDPATPAVCLVDSKPDGTVNSEGQCEALAKNGDGPKTEWEPKFSMFEDLTTAQTVVDPSTNFTAGIIAGYNAQRGRTVFGFEADVGQVNEMEALSSSSYSSVDADGDALAYIDEINDLQPGRACENPGQAEPGKCLDGDDFGLIAKSPTSILTTANADMGLRNLATIRGRLGRTFHDDRIMAFVTGGVAFGKISTEGSVTYSGTLDDGDEKTDDSFSETHKFGDEGWEVGWTAGAGVNYMIGDQAILGLTYLYTDLGTHKVKDSFEMRDDGTAKWGDAGDYSSVSGSVEGEMDARFHSLRASFTILFN